MGRARKAQHRRHEQTPGAHDDVVCKSEGATLVCSKSRPAARAAASGVSRCRVREKRAVIARQRRVGQEEEVTTARKRRIFLRCETRDVSAETSPGKSLVSGMMPPGRERRTGNLAVRECEPSVASGRRRGSRRLLIPRENQDILATRFFFGRR